MNPIVITGIIIITGFLCGELATRLKLPKITGYIVAGIFLNPDLFHFIPKEVLSHTDLITQISLSFITFSVGGTLLYSRIKELGRGIMYITFFEAQLAFLFVFAGMVLCAPGILGMSSDSFVTGIVPLGIMAAALASATDPSATLAITHEYKARGDVTSTIMGVSAFDDVLGIINYSFAFVIAGVLVAGQKFNLEVSVGQPLIIIFGSVVMGILFGAIFNRVSWMVSKEKEGVLIVLILGLLMLCYGSAQNLGFDQLLSTMVMGVVVINFNHLRDRVFRILERYTEELVFVLFFTISGMQLDFSTLQTTWLISLIFILLRAGGKITGTSIGAHLAGCSKKVKKYTSAGLIPQGGIVIGMALLVKQSPQFSHIGDIILSVIIGSTVVQELIGPMLVKKALKDAGEI